MKKIYAYALLLALLLTLLPGAALALDPVKLTALEGTDNYGKLVDGGKANQNGWESSVDGGGAYIIVEASEAIKLTQYKFYNSHYNVPDRGKENRNPKDWTLYGCNNYTGTGTESWVLIQEKVNDTTVVDQANGVFAFDCSGNLAYYKYYKLVITANKGNTDNNIELGEMEFFGSACTHSRGDDGKCSKCGFHIVAQVGDKWYTDLQAAVNNAAGGTVTLLSDLTLKNELEISSTVTLDLAGHSLTHTGGDNESRAIYINGDSLPSLTLMDSVGGGTLSNPAGSAVHGNRGSFILRSGSITGSKTGVYITHACPFTMEGGVIDCSTAIKLFGDSSEPATMYAHGGRVYGTVCSGEGSEDGQNGIIDRKDSTITTSTAFYGEVINAREGWFELTPGTIRWGTFYGRVTDHGAKNDNTAGDSAYRFNGSISGGTFYGPVIVDVDGNGGLRISGGSFLGGLYDREATNTPLPLSSINSISDDKKASYTVTFVFPDGTSQSSTAFAIGEAPVLTGGPLWKGHTLIWCYQDGTPYSFGTPLTGSLTLYGREENGSIFTPSDGVSLWYEGGNTFGSSRAATPTSVEIDGEPVSFSGSGSRFTVRRLPRNARWITARWNSTSVTVSFTPDADAYIAEVAIPKTGDASIAAYGLLALLAAAGVLRKK